MYGNVAIYGGYGNSLNATLAGLLIVLAKVLLVVLVIAVFVGIAMAIKNTFLKDADSSELVRKASGDPTIRTVAVTGFAAIAILIIVSLIQSYTNSGMRFNAGFSYGNSINIVGLLNFLIGILAFVLIVSVVIGLANYLKQQIEKGAFENVVGSFKTSKVNSYNKEEDIKAGEATIIDVEPTLVNEEAK